MKVIVRQDGTSSKMFGGATVPLNAIIIPTTKLRALLKILLKAKRR